MHPAVIHASSLDQIGRTSTQWKMIDCLSLANFVVLRSMNTFDIIKSMLLASMNMKKIS
jgi:hypothetical protein